MPEPSLLETLRQEHQEVRMWPGRPNICGKCGHLEPWPCPVAQLIERSEALAKAAKELDEASGLVLDDECWGDMCVVCGAVIENGHAEDCEAEAFRAALAAYREGP